MSSPQRPVPPARQVRRLIEEACNQGNLSVLEQALASPASATTSQRLPELLAAFRTAVPDCRWMVEEQIVGRGTVVTRLSIQGTFSGPLLGLAPPGRPATVSGVVISRFAGGRLVSLWLQADLLGLLQQLGVMPQLDLTQAAVLAQVQGIGAQLREIE
jgi:predicted ester cyclase